MANLREDDYRGTLLRGKNRVGIGVGHKRRKQHFRDFDVERRGILGGGRGGTGKAHGERKGKQFH